MSKYAKIWDKNFSDAEKNSPWFKIMQWIKPGEDILDVGCSSGYFGEQLMRLRNATVWGLELDHSDAIKAKKRGYQEVYEGDLDTFDWTALGGKKFNSILFVDVLEHVKDPLAVLEAAQKLLKPGGFIYISTPNIAHISVRVELLEGNFDYESTGILDSTHLRFFTTKNIIKLFHDAGMEIIHRDATVNDVPDGQVKARLKKLGLEPTAQFNELLKSNEARAFQHIIGARMAGKKAALPAALKMSSKLRDEWQEIKVAMANNHNRMQDLEREVKDLRQQNSELEAHIKRIKSNPAAWIIKGAVRRIKKHD